MKRLCLSKWGLIGNYKIDQYSLAPIMWRKLFRRLNMPVKYFVIGSDRKKTIIDKIELLTQDDNFIGANIAVPWKGLAYNLCDKTYLFNELDVVNTIVKNNRNELIGYNSDGEGLVNGIKKCTNVKGKTIVIIGSGGSAQTIPLYLLKGGVKAVYVNDIIISKSRKLVSKYSSLFKKNKSNIICFAKDGILNNIRNADILINATPCGMMGCKQKYPFDKRFINDLKKSCLIVDTIYNPKETPLIKEAKRNGNPICPGYNMLIEQAAISFKYAFGFKLTNSDKEEMRKTITKEYEKR